MIFIKVRINVKWEQRKLGEFYSFKNGLNKGKEYFGHGVPIVNYTDVYHHRSLELKDLKGRVELTSNEVKNNSAKTGDLFFTRTSETIDEIGFPAILLSASNDTVFSGFLIRVRPIGGDPLDLLFKKYVFYTKTFRQEMMRKSTITTRALTSGKNLSSMIMAFPDEIKEQNSIGNLLTKLDNLITLQQRKLRQLKQLKMVMLQQLFVDKNNQQPNLRFKKFNGDWELHKLGDVILDYKKKNNNDLLPVLTSSFQGIEYQEKHFGSKQKHDTSDYNVLPKEYMTYRNRSDNGYFRFNINKLGITGIVSKFYPVFTTINTNKQFLASYLNYNPRLKNYFKVVSVGTSQHVLSLKNLKKTNLLFPSKSEQDQIGYFFNLLNKIIFLQQNKLTQLTTLKKYLLQKMFI
ncbi:restriction endonuclease subunit S [Limosilactobacillus reuteri]|uniref:restriction endonuclease subunit S n=1 Tax=Limosilactobacillus reuteri TaxID=1598 RepID=UPI002D1FAD22|nr:restriction endonuclease subunit S [Limosilactobacillus reuteri]